MKDFLLQNRTEAKKVSIYEYNEEEHMCMERKDAYEDSLAAGRDQIFELMNRMISDGCGHQTSRLASDPAFYDEMVKKYLD